MQLSRTVVYVKHIAKVPSADQLHKWELPGKSQHRVLIDCAGPFEGKIILVIVDAHNKYIDTYVISKYLDCLYCAHNG